MSTSAGPSAFEDHARLLKVLRKIRRMTQRDLEDASTVSRATLSRIERGQKDIETKDRVKLARGLGISVGTFDAVSVLLRRIDREAATAQLPRAGAELEWPGSSRVESELGEGSAEARTAIRWERHRRIAEAAGKSTEETVFQMLQVGDLDAHDEY